MRRFSENMEGCFNTVVCISFAFGRKERSGPRAKTFVRLRSAIASHLILLVVAAPAIACLNDEDTLASEARARPEALQAITGRFARNPPLYYQMRIARESAQIDANPSLLDKYDDVAVAYDRLGDDDAAIAWIEKKHAHLPPYDAHNSVVKEKWYRYYANVGTFWVHRWARHGADRNKLDEVKTARIYIAHAIAIKPNAHFGREKYQLKVMDWIIQPNGQSLADALQGYPSDEAYTALSGLIELGGAWQSLDIYCALAQVLLSNEEDTHALGLLALLRVAEIERAGGRSLHPETFQEEEAEPFFEGGENEPEYFRHQYYRLRTEADDWEAKRTAYMMARLTKGDHPDTDPAFWANYHDDGPPEIVPERELRKRAEEDLEWEIEFAAFVGMALCSGTIVLFRRRKMGA